MKELLHGLRNVMFAFGIQPTQRSSAVPAEVKALAEQRWAAKQAKNWAEADRLRGAITALGWAMLDSKTEYKLEPAKKA